MFGNRSLDENPSTVLRTRSVWHLLAPRIAAQGWRLILGVALMLMSTVSSVVCPYATRFLIDDIILKGKPRLLLPLTLILISAAVVHAIALSLQAHLTVYAAHTLVTDLRKQVQEHVGRLSINHYESTNSGELLSRIMNDTDSIRDLIGPGLVKFAGGLATAAFALVVLIRINILMTSLTTAFLILLAYVIKSRMETIRATGRRHNEIHAEVSSRLLGSLTGVQVVKAYAAEAREAAVFAKGATRLLENRNSCLVAVALMQFALTAIIGIFTAMIILIGAQQVFAKHLTLGGLLTFISFIAFLVSPVLDMVTLAPSLTWGLAGLERTSRLLEESTEENSLVRKIRLPRIRGEVACQHVDFSYGNGTLVLRDINFRAMPGSVTALIGPSGSGKSTIISLLAAFHKPNKGLITVDGIDLSTIQLNSYRSQLGMVLQDTFLFDATIEENVAFARPDATPAQIVEACRIARVDEFTELLQAGYKTLVGERGVKLSGGQRQRVSIARAILANPRILILDEATSNVDFESEILIQQGLKYLMKGRTTFVVTHRLSAVRQADQILLIESGRIVERGTHCTLLAAGKRYGELYARQHGRETDSMRFG